MRAPASGAWAAGAVHLRRLLGRAGRSEASSLFVVLAVGNVSNFAFHVLATRLLGPTSYGALGALLAVLVTLTVPITAVQTALTRSVGERVKEGGEVALGRHLAAAAALALACAAALVAAAPFLSAQLSIHSEGAARLLGLYLVPAIACIVPRAALHGTGKLKSLSVSIVTGAAGRLVLAWLLVAASPSVASALTAVVLAESLALLVALRSARRWLRRGDTGAPLRFGDGVRAVVAFFGMWLLAGADTFLARKSLPGREAGLYTAASTLGRIAFYAPHAVALVYLPRFVAAATAAEAHVLLRRAAALCLAIGAAATLALTAWPSLVVGVFFGPSFGASAAVLPVLAAAGTALGLINLLVHHHLARGGRSSPAPWLALVLAAAAARLFGAGPLSLAVAYASSVGLGAFAAYLLAIRSCAEAATMPPRAASLGPAELDLTVVVPFHNPGPPLRRHIVRMLAVLEQKDLRFEIVAVADGCTDGSEHALDDLSRAGVRTIVLEDNQGKGAALRHGFAVARGRYLGFIDADGDLDAGLLDPFIELMHLYEPDIVLGSKRHPMSEVDYPPIRRFYSFCYQLLVRVLFRLRVRDTQTGVKLMRRDVLEQVLPRARERGFVFDLELLALAQRAGYRRFFEAPVLLTHEYGSTVSVRTVVAMLVATLRLAHRHYFDAAVPGASSDSAREARLLEVPA